MYFCRVDRNYKGKIGAILQTFFWEFIYFKSKVMKNIFLLFFMSSLFGLNAQTSNNPYQFSYGASYAIEGSYVHGIMLERRIKTLGAWTLSGALAYHHGDFADVMISSQQQAAVELNVLYPHAIHVFTFGGYLSRDLYQRPSQRISVSAGVLGRTGEIILSKLVNAEPISGTYFGHSYVGWSLGYDAPYDDKLNVVLPIKFTYELQGRRHLSYLVSPYYYFMPTPLGYHVQLLGLSVGVGF